VTVRRRSLVVVVPLAAVLAVLTVWVGVGTTRQRMSGIESICASVYEADKTRLSGHHWGWFPPGWVCEYDQGDEPFERRLPIGRRS